MLRPSTTKVRYIACHRDTCVNALPVYRLERKGGRYFLVFRLLDNLCLTPGREYALASRSRIQHTIDLGVASAVENG